MAYNEWLDIDVLEDYLDGKLDAKTMYRVEKLSLEDPFVAEALEGLSRSPKRTQTLSLLQKQLQERITQKPIETKRWTLVSHRLSIGAAAAVLFVTVSILFWMKENNNQQNSAKEAKKVEVNIAPQVAKTTEPIQSPPHTPPARPTISSNGAVQAKANPTNKENEIAKVSAIANPTAVVAIAKPNHDSIALVNDKAKVAAVNTAVAKIKTEENNIRIGRKIERSRETALPSKVEGIYVVSGMAEKQKESVINGRVYSKNDRQPIPGVTVKINGSNKATTTNNKGEFTLPVDSNSQQSLSIAYLGFTTKVVNTHSNDSVNIELEQVQQNLNEVAVFDAEKKDAANKLVYAPTAAYYPIGGWQGYESYLVNNNSLIKNGSTGKEVVLSFEVKPNGNPTKIVVIKSGGKTLDREAIRLLSDGPRWRPIDKNKKGTSQITVKF